MPKIIRLKVEDDFPGGLSLWVDACPKGNLSDLFHDGFFVADQVDRRDILCGVGAIFFREFDFPIHRNQYFFGNIMRSKNFTMSNQ